MQSGFTEEATSKVLLRWLLLDSLHKFWQLQTPREMMKVTPDGTCVEMFWARAAVNCNYLLFT